MCMRWWGQSWGASTSIHKHVHMTFGVALAPNHEWPPCNGHGVRTFLHCGRYSSDTDTTKTRIQNAQGTAQQSMPQLVRFLCRSMQLWGGCSRPNAFPNARIRCSAEPFSLSHTQHPCSKVRAGWHGNSIVASNDETPWC
jgi:hypothetical protein